MEIGKNTVKCESFEEFLGYVIKDEERIDRAWKKESIGDESTNIYNEVFADENDFENLITELFLGKDWYVVDCLGCDQIRTIKLVEIYKKYKKMKNQIIGAFAGGVIVGIIIALLF